MGGAIVKRQREAAVGDREQDGVGRRARDYDWRSLPPHIPRGSRAGAGGDSAGAAPTPHPRSSPRRGERARVLPDVLPAGGCGVAAGGWHRLAPTGALPPALGAGGPDYSAESWSAPSACCHGERWASQVRIGAFEARSRDVNASSTWATAS